MLNRRSILTGLLGIIAAPAIVRASSLMPIKAWAGEAFIDVKTYGAIGDGVADDVGAFHRALAALAPGGKLYVPAGNYRLQTTLIVPPGLGIEGAGSVTRLDPRDGDTGIRFL